MGYKLNLVNNKLVTQLIFLMKMEISRLHVFVDNFAHFPTKANGYLCTSHL